MLELYALGHTGSMFWWERLDCSIDLLSGCNIILEYKTEKGTKLMMSINVALRESLNNR